MNQWNEKRLPGLTVEGRAKSLVSLVVLLVLSFGAEATVSRQQDLRVSPTGISPHEALAKIRGRKAHRRLQAAEVDFLCMSCNTAHYFHGRLSKATFPKPGIIHLPPCAPSEVMIYYIPISNPARVVKLADTHA